MSLTRQCGFAGPSYRGAGGAGGVAVSIMPRRIIRMRRWRIVPVRRTCRAMSGFHTPCHVCPRRGRYGSGGQRGSCPARTARRRSHLAHVTAASERRPRARPTAWRAGHMRRSAAAGSAIRNTTGDRLARTAGFGGQAWTPRRCRISCQWRAFRFTGSLGVAPEPARRLRYGPFGGPGRWPTPNPSRAGL